MNDSNTARIYTQDWHIHTTASYDGLLPTEQLVKNAAEIGITQFGVSDHVNFPFMFEHLKKSRRLYDQNRVEGFHFGVELTTVSRYQVEYAVKMGLTADATLPYGLLPEFVHPGTTGPDPVVLPLTEEQLREVKVEYVIAAAHWVFNCPTDRMSLIRNWHDQQMYCATDSRVDVIGHPWWMPWFPGYEKLYNAEGKVTGEPWFDDFKAIPQSMQDEFAAALLDNGKCAELNLSFFTAGIYSESFKHQYTEYIRWLFEKGVPITIGSDTHDVYGDHQHACERYLSSAGFTAADFSVPRFRTYD